MSSHQFQAHLGEGGLGIEGYSAEMAREIRAERMQAIRRSVGT
jgi:hypothetical protein